MTYAKNEFFRSYFSNSKNTTILGMSEQGFKQDRSYRIRHVGMQADIAGAQQLLDDGMNVNEKDSCLQYSMLLHAITYMYETPDRDCPPDQTRLDFINFLLDKGANIKTLDAKWTAVPMLLAPSSKIGVKIIQILLDRGANINTSHPDNGMTALHLAAWNGRLGVVSFLLDQKGIKIDAIDNERQTPLMRAAFWGYFKVVKALLGKGAREDIKDDSDRSAHDYAQICTDDGEWRNGEKTTALLAKPPKGPN